MLLSYLHITTTTVLYFVALKMASFPKLHKILKNSAELTAVNMTPRCCNKLIDALWDNNYAISAAGIETDLPSKSSVVDEAVKWLL